VKVDNSLVDVSEVMQSGLGLAKLHHSASRTKPRQTVAN
jgi:hypothetical protein